MASFKTALSDVELCNRAFDLVFQDPIPSLDGQVSGLAARTARRWYKPTVAWLLERHHWNLAAKRGALALIANTRTAQWRYAYALPADAAYIFGTSPANSGVGYYQALRGLLDRQRFERVGSTLYSSVEMVDLDYTSYDTTEAQFSEEFANVIVLMLASRFAMPITKKVTLAERYEKMATEALLLALARNANENQPTYGDSPTETELARGVGLDTIWHGYPINPLAAS